MHKFLAFLLTVGGSVLIMSSVSFAAPPVPAPASTTTTIERNTLPLNPDGYDEIFINNRAAQLLDVENDDTGITVRKLFVNDVRDANGNILSSTPSDLVVMANIIIGAVALLFLAINAANFIIARGEEENLNKVKVNIGYVIMGLLAVAAANILAFSVFNVETKDFLTGNEVSQSFYDLVIQAKVLVQYIIVAIATLSLIVSGYELITRMGSEDSFTKEKEFIKHFLLAAGLIALAEVLVRGVFYARDAGRVDVQTAVDIGITEIVGLTNFLLGLVAAAATLMLVLASFYYVMSFGDEERGNKAKRIIISCIVGIIIAISAYTFVAYFTGL